MKYFLLIIALISSPAFALSVDTPLADSAQEARAKALFTEIRCVVCQSEAIADSPAEVARDMRSLIRKEVASGKTEDEITASLVAAYGDRILMSPPVRNHLGLWLAPLLLLLGGAAFAWRKIFR